MSPELTGALAGGAACLVASPYLARLTLSVPDRERRDWWRGEPATRARMVVTAAVALLFGGLGGAAATWGALWPAFLAYALLCTPLAIIDLECHRLPNRLVLLFAGAAAAFLTLAAAVDDHWHAWLRAAEGAAAVYAVLLALALISPKGFGYGDVKIGGVLGGYLGWFGWLDVYFGIFAGFLLGSVVAVAVMAAGRGTRKTLIPFGPMLILGPLLVIAFDLVPSFSS
ncbi:MAG TPA: prepilin peptidase [Jatrophihabitans sp.]|uniref:prepilin peptidase n=1 Tax=Jatrophihabitans sp. TaxID=1932789 RepID=UPI002DF75974|nr:prepilin peptidase [Jatrophihabitans sp.]